MAESRASSAGSSNTVIGVLALVIVMLIPPVAVAQHYIVEEKLLARNASQGIVLEAFCGMGRGCRAANSIVPRKHRGRTAACGCGAGSGGGSSASIRVRWRFRCDPVGLPPQVGAGDHAGQDRAAPSESAPAARRCIAEMFPWGSSCRRSRISGCSIYGCSWRDESFRLFLSFFA